MKVELKTLLRHPKTRDDFYRLSILREAYRSQDLEAGTSAAISIDDVEDEEVQLEFREHRKNSQQFIDNLTDCNNQLGKRISALQLKMGNDKQEHV